MTMPILVYAYMQKRVRKLPDKPIFKMLLLETVLLPSSLQDDGEVLPGPQDRNGAAPRFSPGRRRGSTGPTGQLESHMAIVLGVASVTKGLTCSCYLILINPKFCRHLSLVDLAA